MNQAGSARANSAHAIVRILASYQRGLEDVCEKATNPEVSVGHDKRYFMMRGLDNLT